MPKKITQEECSVRVSIGKNQFDVYYACGSRGLSIGRLLFSLLAGCCFGSIPTVILVGIFFKLFGVSSRYAPGANLAVGLPIVAIAAFFCYHFITNGLRRDGQ